MSKINSLSLDRKIFNITGYLLISIFSILSLMPFIIIISGSLTDEQSIIQNGYSIIPKVFSVEAYRTIFTYPTDIIRAYGVSLYTTVVGTVLSLFLTAMAAYVISRKDFEWRNKFSFFFYFTTIFNGGLVPWYILCVQYLEFKKIPLIALILPYLFSAFNLIILKNFMKDIPDAVVESARIDGANNFTIFARLILPLSKPALATVGLFTALAYWNDWFLGYMFISDSKYYSLQYFLYKMLSAQEALQRISNLTGRDMGSIPTEGIKMAMVVIATGPIILLYPSLQKYFVRGLTIGAVKG